MNITTPEVPLSVELLGQLRALVTLVYPMRTRARMHARSIVERADAILPQVSIADTRHMMDRVKCQVHPARCAPGDPRVVAWRSITAHLNEPGGPDDALGALLRQALRDIRDHTVSSRPRARLDETSEHAMTLAYHAMLTHLAEQGVDID